MLAVLGIVRRDAIQHASPKRCHTIAELYLDAGANQARQVRVGVFLVEQAVAVLQLESDLASLGPPEDGTAGVSPALAANPAGYAARHV